MRGFRRFLADRLSGGAFCALLAYLFIAQTLIAGMARGAVAGEGQTLGVICAASISAGTAVPEGHTAGLDIPCAGLCELAASTGPGDLVPGAVAVVADLQDGRDDYAAIRPEWLAGRHILAFAARAPPALSD